jgi:SPP1 gp7 family putative phage head morphogenesis protein
MRRGVAGARFPKQVERELAAYLKRRARARAKALELALAPALEIAERGDRTLGRVDALEDVAPLLRGIELARVAFERANPADGARSRLGSAARQVELFATRRTIETVQRAQRVGLRAPLEVQTDLFRPRQDLYSAFARRNVEQIGKLDARFYDEIGRAVRRTVGRGRPTSELRDLIRQRAGGSERWAALVARDQIGTLNAAITKTRFEEIGIQRYVWRTMDDERVRPEHEARDGLEFGFDDPPPDGNPGEPIACRCVAIPVFGD